ncbi:hypothetical protein J4221_06635 [Candidatus Pacearchaeota archaeon]|nr:hypothetical protein [Candidatus Pacearchaeota archaeon]
MGNNKNRILFSLIIVVLLISYVQAITGSIGNARMVLRLKQWEKIEKCILVKNVNDVAVNVGVSQTGELAEYINLKDKEFSLEPKTEKKACFDLMAAKSGTTESKINIKFAPVDGKNGVGLSSTIIVIAEESEPGLLNNIFADSSDNSEDVDAESGQALTGNKILKKTVIVSSGITIVLFAILLVLLVLYSKKKKIMKVVTVNKTKKSMKAHE